MKRSKPGTRRRQQQQAHQQRQGQPAKPPVKKQPSPRPPAPGFDEGLIRGIGGAAVLAALLGHR